MKTQERVMNELQRVKELLFLVSYWTKKQEKEDLQVIKDVLQRALNIERETLDETQEELPFYREAGMSSWGRPRRLCFFLCVS